MTLSDAGNRKNPHENEHTNCAGIIIGIVVIYSFIERSYFLRDFQFMIHKETSYRIMQNIDGGKL